MQPTTSVVSQTRLQRLVFALFMAFLSGVVIVYIIFDHQHVRDSENEKLITQANVVSANIEQHLISLDRMLEEILALRAFVDTEQRRDHIQSLMNAMPVIRAISMLDANGRQIMGTRDINNGADLSERPYFQNVLADPQPLKLHISPPYLSLRGDLNIALSKAMLDEDNDFEGVVVIALDPGYLRGLMQSTLYASDMWAALRHLDGVKAIRVQGGIPGERQDTTSGEIGLARLPQPWRDGNPLVLHSQDGITRQLVATSTVASNSAVATLPLQVVMGRDYATAMADWRRFAILQGGLLALFIITTTMGLIIAQRHHQRYATQQEQDQRRIQEGQALIKAQERDYRIIVEHTSTCIIKLDENGHYSYINPAFNTLFRVAPDEIIGRHFSSLMTEDDKEAARESMAAVMRQSSTEQFRAKCITPTGIRHMEWALCPVQGSHDTVHSVIGIGHDISAHITLREKLQILAERDGLTGLFNRRHFMELATIQVAHAHRYGQPLALMALDLDHFKQVNDTWGHHAGDLALQTCANLMQQISRASDIPARIGGEEFVILLPGTQAENAAQAAEKLRTLIEQHPITHEDGAGFQLTTSIGIAALLAGDTLESLMRRADEALYNAKRNGRNQVATVVCAEASGNPA